MLGHGEIFIHFFLRRYGIFYYFLFLLIMTSAERPLVEERKIKLEPRLNGETPHNGALVEAR